MREDDEPFEEIYSRDGTRRVVLFRRPTGSFGYAEQYHYANEYAEGWARLPDSSSIYDSLETARREVVGNVDWLRTQRNGAA